jgi:hypothetical protein
VGQLPQVGYQALLTPYSYFGLGRTNNYIENLFVGSTKHTEEHYINMEGVIPNSKVVIIPPIEAGGSWRKELYLRPGEWIPWVTLTMVMTTIILAITVFVLHLNEKVCSLVVATWLLLTSNSGLTSWREEKLHTILTLTPYSLVPIQQGQSHVVILICLARL